MGKNCNSYEADIPVALIFFNRADVLKETFNSIKKARPRQLFLIQDGARTEITDDSTGIIRCREIVCDIDWECEIYTNYSDINLGCGRRVFTGISWAFEYVDRLVILEDDSVPNDSFFKFCEIILEKYKNDERIDMISGMNHLGEYHETPYDYIFSKTGAICAWATWKRVWKTVDYEMSFLNDKEAERLITNYYGKELYKKGRTGKKILEDGNKLSFWSYQKGINMFLQSRLIIIPRYNLISNIGLTKNSANSGGSINIIPKGLRRIYYMKTHELEFPLKYPKYVIDDVEFKRRVDRIMGFGHPLVNIYRTLESIFYRIINGDLESLLRGLKRRLSL